jgi:hypothetical protein
MGHNASTPTRSSLNSKVPPKLKRGDSFYDSILAMTRRHKPIGRDFLHDIPYVIGCHIASYLGFRDHHILRRVNQYWNSFFLILARKHHEQQMDTLYLSLSSNHANEATRVFKRQTTPQTRTTPRIDIPKRKSLYVYINTIHELRNDPNGSPVSS